MRASHNTHVGMGEGAWHGATHSARMRGCLHYWTAGGLESRACQEEEAEEEEQEQEKKMCDWEAIVVAFSARGGGYREQNTACMFVEDCLACTVLIQIIYSMGKRGWLGEPGAGG